MDFNSSDEENDNTPIDTTPLHVDWLDLSEFGGTGELGVCALPGCRFKDTWRSLKSDIATLKSLDVEDVFVLCSKGELSKYRTSQLFEAYKQEEITVHHNPFPDGQTPSFEEMISILEDLRSTLDQGKKTIIHCFGGLGRSCLIVACLLMWLQDSMDSTAVIENIKKLRGSGAVQSVKQFNFINDFREKLAEHTQSQESTSRSVSR